MTRRRSMVTPEGDLPNGVKMVRFLEKPIPGYVTHILKMQYSDGVIRLRNMEYPRRGDYIFNGEACLRKDFARETGKPESEFVLDETVYSKSIRHRIGAKFMSTIRTTKDAESWFGW